MKTRNRVASAFLLIFFMLFPLGGVVFSEVDEVRVSEGESIQEVIDAASPGTTIIVQQGTYDGNVVLSKPLKLIGEDAVIDGDGRGSVITVDAPDTTVEGFTITNGGKLQQDAGVRINSSNNVIRNNTIQEVQVGIYVDKAEGNVLIGNTISSFDVHFSRRGNGIHLYKGEGNIVRDNHIRQVQDGVYFDFEKDAEVTGNDIAGIRYALHFMYADGGRIKNNTVERNITGLMIMGSEDLTFVENRINKQLTFRGYGVLIFDSDRITLQSNQLTYNSTGLSLQDARDSRIERNMIAGNHVGFHLKNRNEGNVLSENNLVGNVIQTRVAALNEPLDDGTLGNYWDDYRGLDMNGDGIGEIPYESGTVFDRLLVQHPEFQFYFESPSMKMWNTVEKILPSIATEKGMDRFPSVKPFMNETDGKGRLERMKKADVFVLSLFFIMVSGLIMYRGGVRK